MQTIARIAEQRISQAIKDGALDNLEGAGKPLRLEDFPAYEQEIVERLTGG